MAGIDLTGQRFGRLTVESKSPRKSNFWYWYCICDCGNRVEVRSTSLTTGNGKSCGCLVVDSSRERMLRHGHARKNMVTGEFRAWQKMRERCYNKNNKNYSDYGGRGITVCERWLESFDNFIADMGSKPTLQHSIDRVDNNGNYEPSNCRWATKSEQCFNRRPWGSVNGRRSIAV